MGEKRRTRLSEKTERKKGKFATARGRGKRHYKAGSGGGVDGQWRTKSARGLQGSSAAPGDWETANLSRPQAVSGQNTHIMLVC